MNEYLRIAPNQAASGGRRAVCMVNVKDRDPGSPPEEMAAFLQQVADRRDIQAFSALFRFYAPRLKSFLMRQGFSDIESEDLIQETMLNLWRKADSFDGDKAGVSTWIFTIARNCGIDRRRRIARMSALPAERDTEEADPDPSVEQRIIVQESEKAIRAALARLPDEQATVIRLSYFAESPQTEIARSLGVPLGTVKSRVRLALQRLRQMMENE